MKPPIQVRVCEYSMCVSISGSWVHSLSGNFPFTPPSLFSLKRWAHALTMVSMWAYCCTHNAFIQVSDRGGVEAPPDSPMEHVEMHNVDNIVLIHTPGALKSRFVKQFQTSWDKIKFNCADRAARHLSSFLQCLPQNPVFIPPVFSPHIPFILNSGNSTSKSTQWPYSITCDNEHAQY